MRIIMHYLEPWGIGHKVLRTEGDLSNVETYEDAQIFTPEEIDEDKPYLVHMQTKYQVLDVGLAIRGADFLLKSGGYMSSVGVNLVGEVFNPQEHPPIYRSLM